MSTAPIKSKSAILSKSVSSSSVSSEPRTRPFTSSEKKQSTFCPAKGGESVSSLSVSTVNLGKGSGIVPTTTIFASPLLNLPPSS